MTICLDDNTRGDIRTDEVGRGRRTEKHGKKRGRGDFNDRREFPAVFSYPYITKNPLILLGGIFSLNIFQFYFQEFVFFLYLTFFYIYQI